MKPEAVFPVSAWPTPDVAGGLADSGHPPEFLMTAHAGVDLAAAGAGGPTGPRR
ncbi:hypothetical protein ACIBQ1_38590 [Nonomuraea sp. NPDC050153]|uniref:hypothetical protein n=1 Tax=Nonomuraea sp. NPDC050153 TaxID=3364359 RepID=UPI00379804D9